MNSQIAPDFQLSETSYQKPVFDSENLEYYSRKNKAMLNCVRANKDKLESIGQMSLSLSVTCVGTFEDKELLIFLRLERLALVLRYLGDDTKYPPACAESLLNEHCVLDELDDISRILYGYCTELKIEPGDFISEIEINDLNNLEAISTKSLRGHGEYANS
jgi:hypothetical protein